MKIAVLSLTRDRLDYTRHCFQTLHDNAGCEFDHYVLDQASTDGTVEWLEGYDAASVCFSPENIGVCRGLNTLLEEAFATDDYDVIVGFDNDCELLTPNTLADCAAVAHVYPAIVSPHIRGLRNPPKPIGHTDGITEVPQLGNIFRAHPAEVFTDYGYRFNENAPLWGGDEAICHWFRDRGGIVGYLDGYEANHYLGTEGQVADIPWYFERRVLEGGPAR